MGRANVGVCVGVGVGGPKWTQVDPSGLRWTQGSGGEWRRHIRWKFYSKNMNSIVLIFHIWVEVGKEGGLVVNLDAYAWHIVSNQTPSCLLFYTKWVDTENSVPPTKFF